MGSVYGLQMQKALWKLTLWHSFTWELSCRAVISLDAYLASLLCFSGLLHEQNMAKMRLLTFMGMAVENKEISFDTMQQELQIGADDVEAFVIDGKAVGTFSFLEFLSTL